MLHNGRIPSALLFTGREGVGKGLAARAFAMALNCPAAATAVRPPPGSATEGIDACGHCRSCRRIDSDQHPDLLTVAPEGQAIRIGRIRSILTTLAMKPYEAAVRVVIIDDAHCMNPEAANALLKLLEEPPDRTLFILIAPRRNDLLPTVASRCQSVRFAPIPEESLRYFLTAERGVAEEKAATLAALAGGSYAKALLLADSDWADRRAWLAGILQELPGLPTVAVMAAAERMASDKSTVEEMLYLTRTWLRDCIVYRQAPDRIHYPDLATGIGTWAARFGTAALLAKAEAVDRALARIAGNGNVRLALEVMLLKLAV